MNRNLVKHIIFFITLALLTVAGEAWAQQTTGQFVIKTTVETTTHYLSHANNALGDADAFSPNVLWTSDNTHTQGGANRNYYFMEGTTPHFLGAPTFEAGGALSLSASLPLGNQLSNPESQYYFYRWDDGLGRGVQYYGDCANNSESCVECGHVWGQGQCWDVYWVAYIDATWKLSAKKYFLNEVPTGGKFYPVTITEHGIDTTILMVTVGEVQVPSGLQALQGFEMDYSADPLSTHQVNPTIYAYQYTVRPAYTTYVFDGGTHNYYDAGSGAADQGESTPASENSEVNQVADATYAWTLSGPGATYLTIDNATSANPTITYSTQNETGHKTATLTLTVTYRDGSKQSTSANILVKTPCQNPPVQDENATVTFVGATVSWDPTATSYLVSWRVYDHDNSSSWNSHEVGDVTSYTITGLEYETTYEYKVKATSCSTEEPAEPYPTFTTLEEPGLMITGAIFGGGRMADVGGKTEVVVVNCDSIGAIFGGNDIAGTVLDTISANHTAGYAGANITLGVNLGNPYDYHTTYGTTPNDGKIRVSSVYGGGNGYYAYNGTSFVPATSSYTSETVAVGACVKAMTQSHQVGDVVWTNDGTTSKTLNFPSITNTAIIATNNLVKVDSIFGGAKNAFLTANSGDGDSIVINGGTVFAVFGGNNWGGGQGYGIHHIEVNGTTTSLTADITNTPTTGYGRDFGIRYLFGGGNKVAGSTTDIHIKGGQSDEVFAGGNAADVYKANVMVECSLGADAGNHLAFGDTYTNAIDPNNYSQGTIDENTVFANYGWDGHSGIYNVRSLYGGNNEAEMQRVPNVTLTSGSVGTVYGGGNAGDMMGSASTTINGNTVLYGTHVVLNSNQILTDYIYGGCRMSNVYNSTWVELKEGHVGTVYGGCNISGDVGSTRVYDPYPSGQTYPQSLEEQRVKGATYVQAGNGGSDTDLIVYKDLFAGSNGYYHCSSDGIQYNEDELFGYPETLYAGMDIPTHNETNVVVTTGTTVKGNVYAGGNLAPVGFFDNTGFYRGYPELVGMATVVMTGGRVEQNVYGGGNMASIFGRNEVKVSGGTIVKGLYGGNDRAGQVAERTNRKLPTGYGYTVASDNETSLTNEGVMTFVGVSGNARIGTVYGGGNGDYTYGGEGGIPFCGDTPSHPIQPFTFVDIHLAGGSSGGKINTVYGGGNGVTVRGGAIVFMNIVEPEPAQDYTNVDTIFGGNNKGNIEIVPDIRLLHGQVGTVYGGCNQGAMMADNTSAGNTTVSVGGYENIGSYVRLYNTYVASADSTHTVTAKVKDAVYGGCRMNGVSRNSLVLVEGGDFSTMTKGLFGGSDISGEVEGFSRVAVVAGTAGNVFGGGNGYYTYNEGNVYTIPTSGDPVLVATGVTATPNSVQSGVDMTNGTAANLYASGNACGSGATLSNISGGTVTSGIYGGSNAKGTVTGDIVVNVTGGLVGASTSAPANIHGGGYGAETQTGGNVLVNIGNVGAASAAATPTIYGEIYGGSALGSVNTNSENTTTVNFLNGTLHGNVYGGGLGDATLNSNGYINQIVTEAIVNGTVHVNIGDDDETNYSNYLNIDGKVFGGNNLAGSPKGNIYVDVYRTAHTSDNTCPNAVPNPFPDNAISYALSEVYGGGNLAHYAPTLADASANVHVHNCDNTIRYVYGGGNAANVPAANVTIDGGLIEYVFGGGNGAGTGNPGANVNGDNTIALNGGMMAYVFGGSNTKGFVTGETSLQFADEPACTPRSVNELYGGGNQAADENGITLNVPCGTAGVKTIYGGAKNADVGTENAPANIVLNVSGGDSDLDAVFGGNNQGGTIWGSVTLNLYGGTINNAFGGNNAGGFIKRAIQVNMEDMGGTCALGINTIYGGGNEAAYSPTDASSVYPEVNIKHGTVNNAVYGGGKGSTATVTANPKVVIGDTNLDHSVIVGALLNGSTTEEGLGCVFGGGDAAPVTGSTTVNVFKGEIVHKLVGGGNAANVSGNVVMNITGGDICTASDGLNAGIYGGCNTSGNVGGNITVNIDGTSTTPTTIGTQVALQAVAAANGNAISVHGGGYGVGTSTNGNVTVNFGSADASTTVNNQYLTLWGDMYGGSALGTVNNDADDKTTITLLNGIVKYHSQGNTQFGGTIYGGGLGNSEHAAHVNGEVQVYVGKEVPASNPEEDPTYIGKASLKGCIIYGCNNANGSPQQNVYVDVYQTNHVPTDLVSYEGGGTEYDVYAIAKVYGGGNKADYAPSDNSPSWLKRVHNRVHTCDNTIGYVYGGGRAAATDGVLVEVDGGRFDYIFGGGNGQSAPANIGYGGIEYTVCSGHVGWQYAGCDMGGTIAVPPMVHECDPNNLPCGPLVVDYYFFGDNMAPHYGSLYDTIYCQGANSMKYKKVFGGSRLANIYGDIVLVVKGGEIENLFGGSQGSPDKPGNIKKFPHAIPPQSEWPDPTAGDLEKELYNLYQFMTDNPGYEDVGGNIYVKVEGGSLTNVFGGCERVGNVEGNIIIVVDTIPSECGSSIDTIFGGSMEANYAPLYQSSHSPQVYLKNGHVNYVVYGGGKGVMNSPGTAGSVTSNPLVVLGDHEPNVNPLHEAKVGKVVVEGVGDDAVTMVYGDVFGGGGAAHVTGNTKVCLQGKTEVLNNVFGGSQISDVVGNTDVVIVPETSLAPPSFPAAPTHILTITQVPGGTIEVKYSNGNAVASGSSVAQGTVLNIKATPATGYTFGGWTATSGRVLDANNPETTFTMGTQNATLSAIFNVQ